MIKKLTEKLKNQNSQTKKYNFKHKCTGVAGVCPDCNSFVSFNSYHQRYECLSNNCCFMANLECERIWDNSMRDENIKQLNLSNNF